MAEPQHETDFAKYPIVQDTQMREIFSIDETGEFLKEVLDESVEQAQTTLEELRAAYNDADYERLRERAHFLKGSMAQLGLHRLNRICLSIQTYFDRTPRDALDAARVETLLQCLEAATRETMAYLYAAPDKARLADRVVQMLRSGRGPD